MKRARLVLGAIAAFAVVGGVLAAESSQAGKRSNRYVYLKANPAESICTSTSFFRSLAPQVAGQLPLTTTYATTITGPCTTTAVYTAP
jgi:hypothetical protein